MADNALQVLAVAGSLHANSVTRAVVRHVAARLQREGCRVDVLELGRESPALYNPDTAHDAPGFETLQRRVEAADALILGTPDYHGGVSGALKNFLDHFWREFAGKLIVPVVASHEKGLTVMDQLRTLARQCYAWTLPYGVSFAGNTDVKEGRIVSDALDKRLEMMARDVRVYGALLAQQRRADLAGTEPGFLARLRK